METFKEYMLKSNINEKFKLPSNPEIFKELIRIYEVAALGWKELLKEVIKFKPKGVNSLKKSLKGTNKIDRFEISQIQGEDGIYFKFLIHSPENNLRNFYGMFVCSFRNNNLEFKIIDPDTNLVSIL